MFLYNFYDQFPTFSVCVRIFYLSKLYITETIPENNILNEVGEVRSVMLDKDLLEGNSLRWEIDSLAREVSSHIEVELISQEQDSTEQDPGFVDVLESFLGRVEWKNETEIDIDLPNNLGKFKPHPEIGDSSTPEDYASSLLLALAVCEVPVQSIESNKNLGEIHGWGKMPSDELAKTLEVDSSVKTEKLGDIISEIFPVFDKYKEDMKSALGLAITDKDGFVESFLVSRENSINDRINKFMSRLSLRKGNPVPTKVAYSAITATVVTAIVLSSCYYSPEATESSLENLYTEIASTAEVAEPIATLSPIEEEIISPSQSPTSIEEEIIEPTLNPTPTEEGFVVDEGYSPVPGFDDFDFEISRHGYALIWGDWQPDITEPTQRAILIYLPEFYYERQGVTPSGRFIEGKFDYKGQEISVEIILDGIQSGYVSSRTWHPLKTSADVSKYLKKGEFYYPDLFIVDNEGNPILYSGSYTEEDWFEIRSLIDDILRNGGSSSGYKLVLHILS